MGRWKEARRSGFTSKSVTDMMLMLSRLILRRKAVMAVLSAVTSSSTHTAGSSYSTGTVSVSVNVHTACQSALRVQLALFH